MKKKILITIAVIAVIAVLGITVFMLTGRGNSQENANQNHEEESLGATEEVREAEEEVSETEEVVGGTDNNDNYFVKIKGEEFKVGDKISDLSKVGLKQDPDVLTETLPGNKYMIGAGTIYDENDEDVCDITPYNPTDEDITLEDAVIGGFEVGESDYTRISEEILALDVEVVGGIKLGSSYEDMVAVFGETDDMYESEALGYKVYTYESEEVYRSYEFTVDKDGKVSKIKWQNLVFDE